MTIPPAMAEETSVGLAIIGGAVACLLADVPANPTPDDARAALKQSLKIAADINTDLALARLVKSMLAKVPPNQHDEQRAALKAYLMFLAEKL